MNWIVVVIKVKVKNYDVCLGGVIVNCFCEIDQIDCYNEFVGFKCLVYVFDFDYVCFSCLKKSIFFEMGDMVEIQVIQIEYFQLVEQLWVGIKFLNVELMKDWEIFEFFGFE